MKLFAVRFNISFRGCFGQSKLVLFTYWLYFKVYMPIEIYMSNHFEFKLYVIQSYLLKLLFINLRKRF